MLGLINIQQTKYTMEQEKRQHFFVFYILNYPQELSNIEIQILNRVFSFARLNQEYYESASTLSNILKITDRTIRNNINSLINKDYLTRVIKDESLRFLYITDKTKQLFLTIGGMNDVQGGAELNSGGGMNLIQGGYESNSANSKYIIKIDNKEDITVTANASTNLPLEVKPYLTLEQIKETYKDNIYLDSIIKWYEYKINRKEPYTSISYIKTSLKKHGSNFPIAVNDSIQRNKQGIYLYSKPKAPRQEWQIKKDIEPKTIILFNDLFFSKLDLENFFEICKNSDLKTELKKYMEFRNIQSLKSLNDYFLAIDSEKSQLYNTRLKDFTSSLTNFAVKREMAVQTN